MKRGLFVFLVMTAYAASAAPGGLSQFLDELETISYSSAAFVAEKNAIDAQRAAAFSKLMHWTPEVSLTASRAEALESGGASQNSYAVRADMNLFHAGAQHYAYRAADAQLESQEQKAKEARRQAEKSAAQLIFRRISLLDQQKIFEGLVKIKQESLKVIDRMYRLGRLPQQEITKSEIDLSVAQSRLRSARIELIENDIELKTFIGQTVTQIQWPFSKVQNFKIPQETRLDPRLQMLGFDRQAKEFLARSALASFAPRLDLSVAYNKPWGVSSVENEGTFGYLTLSFPLWSRWETRAALDSAQAALKSADFLFQQEKQRFLLQRQWVQEKFELLRQNLRESEQNLERSKGLFAALEKNFRLGRISVNDILLEQSRLRDVELNHLSQLFQFHSSLVESCLLFHETLRQCFE